MSHMKHCILITCDLEAMRLKRQITNHIANYLINTGNLSDERIKFRVVTITRKTLQTVQEILAKKGRHERFMQSINYQQVEPSNYNINELING